jgi:plasmid stability protein
MAMLTGHNLPDDVHCALQVQADQHGRSTEAEPQPAVRGLIVSHTIRPPMRRLA